MFRVHGKDLARCLEVTAVFMEKGSRGTHLERQGLKGLESLWLCSVGSKFLHRMQAWKGVQVGQYMGQHGIAASQLRRRRGNSGGQAIYSVQYKVIGHLTHCPHQTGARIVRKYSSQWYSGYCTLDQNRCLLAPSVILRRYGVTPLCFNGTFETFKLDSDEELNRTSRKAPFILEMARPCHRSVNKQAGIQTGRLGPNSCLPSPGTIPCDASKARNSDVAAVHTNKIQRIDDNRQVS